MDEPLQLSTAAPPFPSQDYSRLRETGLELIRQIAADTWTDHNLHDPGITMLEALCYALTELGLRTGMDMQDLVASSQPYAARELFSSGQLLPAAPVSAVDFQKVLLDHPLVRNARVSARTDVPKGQLSVLLEFADEALNSNTFPLTVTPLVPGTDYLVNLALPYWDEPDVQPLLDDVQILGAAFDTPWQPIDGGSAQFARVLLNYQPAVGPAQNLLLWVVVQVATPMNDPIVELPAVLQQTGVVLLTTGDNSPADQTVFKQYNRWVTAANAATRSVRRYLHDYRNLCEDFAEFKAVRLQEVAFSAILDIEASVSVEALLADIFFAVDQHITPPIVLQSLEALQAQGEDPATIFQGPLLDSGFLEAEALEAAQPATQLYSSDILRLIFQQRNAERADVEVRERLSAQSIVAVRNLSLSNWLDNHLITSEAKDCLHLVDSDRHVPRLSPAKCQLTFFRNDVAVIYDLARAIEMFEERKTAAQAGFEPGSADIPLPEGTAYPVADYYPVQNDLPLSYGVGPAGLPDEATSARRGQAKQLKAYLFFYEQLLAGQLAQLAQLNALFSADPNLGNSIFQQPLYQIPGVESLLRAFDPAASTWEQFQADPANPYRTTLEESSETEDQFLNRRNRFLDHLLARLGEDMQDFAAVSLRKAAEVPGAAGLSLPQLLAAQQTRRRAAVRRLLRDKSEFYYALPDLNRDRLQAYGNLQWRLKTTLMVQQNASGFGWQLSDFEGNAVLEGAQPAPSPSSAQRSAATALVLSTALTHYAIVTEGGGQRRILLQEQPGAPPLARSILTFNTNPQAVAARNAIRQSMLLKWLEFALTPLESRLCHLLGIRLRQRRVLLHEPNDFFEIFDDPAAPPFAKRFRLWELPGATGDQLLESTGNFTGPDDPTATANANNAIRLAIAGGIDPANYALAQTAPNAFQITLNTPEGQPIARSPGTFPDPDQARAERDRIQQQVYRFYSREGLYLVEHAPLFPSNTGNPGLSLPGAGTDPYSFQITLVFPSGYERDFSIPGDPPTPVQPERFRDEEFRNYAERMARRSCPAHILPKILWVDATRPGAPLNGDEPCFDRFEQRYRAWLSAYLTDDIPGVVLEPLRAALVQTLNAIYLDLSD